MPVDVHGCSRHDVCHCFVGQVLPVDERPPHGINELLREAKDERKAKGARGKAKGGRGGGGGRKNDHLSVFVPSH